MTAGISRSSGSSNPASLFRIEIVVRFREKFFDALAVAAVRGNANARRKDRLFRVASKDFADAVGDTTRFVLLRLWKNQGEFVAAISRGGIDCPAVDAEGIGKTADGAAADEMAKVIVDFFQPIEIKQQNRERPTVAIGAVSLGFQDVEQAAKGGGDNISESNYSEQSAGDFTTWMTRTRQEVLDEKRHHEQKRQSQAAKPPGERRPEQAKRSFWKNLKKENAGGG